MNFDRRRLLALAAAGIPTVAAAAPARSEANSPGLSGTLSALGVDAAHFGVHSGSSDDQTKALHRAIDQAAGARVPLALAPGTYRAANLKLQAGTQLVGIRGATRLLLTDGPSLMAAQFADRIALTGLILDGGGRPLPENRG